MNHYETTVIVNAALEEKQIQDAVERVSEFIKKNDGTISDVDHWGRKRLAYPIKKRNNGYYVRIAYDAPGDMVSELNRFCVIDDDILRELTLIMTDRDIRQREETKARLIQAEQEAEAEEEAKRAKAEANRDSNDNDDDD